MADKPSGQCPHTGHFKAQPAKCGCDNVEFSAPAVATAGKTHPNDPDPSSKPPVPSEYRPDPQPPQPCYLPQEDDGIPYTKQTEMGPIGPWATGRVDWTPLADLTGIRPVVDKYSISRYSESEWRRHNKKLLDSTHDEQSEGQLIDFIGHQSLDQNQANVDKNQEDNTNRLRQRMDEMYKWKSALERAIKDSSDEVTAMEGERQRLKKATSVLQLPESIAGECLERRSGRLDPELVRDEVEEELIKELALTAEIREAFDRALKDVEKQLLEDKIAKQRLEYDWSDKTISYDIDDLNVSLNCRSNIMLFRPGSVIFPEDQSLPEYWEHFTKETLEEGEATRQRSITLRGTLDAILMNGARDLRTQADKVELALSKRIKCTTELTRQLELELKKILQQLADVETLMKNIRNAIRRMDMPMKEAQTRLDNRLLRPRVENCRDAAHFGLIDEVQSISKSVAALQGQLKEAEDSQTALMNARGNLEREIMVKRKTLEIDCDRTQRIRSYYPSAAELSGHA